MNIGTEVMLTADAGDLRAGDKGIVTDVRKDGSATISFTLKRPYHMRPDGSLVPKARPAGALLVELSGRPKARRGKGGPTIPVIERFSRDEHLDEMVEMSRDGSRQQSKTERKMFFATCKAIKEALDDSVHGEVRWPEILETLKAAHNRPGGRNFLYQFDCSKRFLVAKQILTRIGKAGLGLEGVPPGVFELACEHAWKDLPARIH